MRLRIGQTVGSYRILAAVGKGGMGEVYRGDTGLGRDVALKILTGAYTQNPDRLRRFRQEATAASALNHPAILTIHEAGEANGCQFIATEFVDGETVRQVLNRRGRVPMNEALGMAVQVAAALAAAHKAGIVHRDIKRGASPTTRRSACGPPIRSRCTSTASRPATVGCRQNPSSTTASSTGVHRRRRPA